MSAQEGLINCYYCNKRQNKFGECGDCANNNGLNAVITYRWDRDVYLFINDKEYCISFSNMTDNSKVTFARDYKTILEIPSSANLTLQNIKDKLKIYFLFL